jgi:hypothetical protein
MRYPDNLDCNQGILFAIADNVQIYATQKRLTMPDNNFTNLPTEALMNLLLLSTGDLLDALENNLDNGIEIKAKKKQVELIYSAIMEKNTVLTTRA